MDLRTSIDQSKQRIRTHFDIVAESLSDDVQLIATALATLSQHGSLLPLGMEKTEGRAAGSATVGAAITVVVARGEVADSGRAVHDRE